MRSVRDDTARTVMNLYVVSGLAIVGVLMLVGLTMRASQAGWIPLSPRVFYELLTLHGAGMTMALVMCAMGVLWLLMRRRIALRASLAVAAWVLVLGGLIVAAVAVIFGHFAGLYTFLYPLPFIGSWLGWAAGLFLIGMMVMNIGWMIWCLQIFGAVLRAYGGMDAAFGWSYIWRHKQFKASGREPPPPEAFPALVAGVDGLITGMTATLLIASLIVRWIDPRVVIDPLWAKNLTYLYLHAIANLIIYMLAATIYVGLSYATGRDYETSSVFVIGWWGSMVFILTNYFHHLYMDFPQPRILQYVGEVSSYLSAVPVTAVTIFGAMVLIWRAHMRWTLGAIYLYAGLIGWVIGGIGAELDASVPFNLHLHNTLWVPAHFHTYMLGGCLLFVLGWVFLLLEARSAYSTSALKRWMIGALCFGGMVIFLLSFYLAGAAGVPRRYAIQPPPGPAAAAAATVGAGLMVLGFIFLLMEGLRLWSGYSKEQEPWPGKLEAAVHVSQ